VNIDERQRRIGRNEALFREVNERIERVTQSLQVTTETMAILCECGDETCTERIEVSLPEYERVRADSTLFFVCSTHESAGVEEILERREGYDIVRKRAGEAAELARELDRRDN
jgi:hypothetical protein